MLKILELKSDLAGVLIQALSLFRYVMWGQVTAESGLSTPQETGGVTLLRPQ